MANIEERVEELLTDVITQLGYELYDVEYTKEAKNYFLRIYIDSQNGIDLNDCEKVSTAISEPLDQADYIKDQYFLEVSSPGIERVLRKEKQLKKYVGQEINVKLFKKLENEKEIIGILESFDENNIVLKKEEKDIIIDRKNVAMIKTVYHW